jgi:hypothetical protein
MQNADDVPWQYMVSFKKLLTAGRIAKFALVRAGNAAIRHLLNWAFVDR